MREDDGFGPLTTGSNFNLDDWKKNGKKFDPLLGETAKDIQLVVDNAEIGEPRIIWDGGCLIVAEQFWHPFVGDFKDMSRDIVTLHSCDGTKIGPYFLIPVDEMQSRFFEFVDFPSSIIEENSGPDPDYVEIYATITDATSWDDLAARRQDIFPLNRFYPKKLTLKKAWNHPFLVFDRTWYLDPFWLGEDSGISYIEDFGVEIGENF